MNKGQGHVPLHLIKENMARQLEWGGEAPQARGCAVDFTPSLFGQAFTVTVLPRASIISMPVSKS